MATTGKELRLHRQAADLLVKDVAREMGVSTATLWTIERRAEVPSAQAEKFREAVARLTTREAA